MSHFAREDHAHEGAGGDGAGPETTRRIDGAGESVAGPDFPESAGEAVTLDAPSRAQHWEREVGGYRLVRRLGSGGMGTVYEALDGGGRPVALKMLHPHIAADPQARRRLAREVALMHRVSGTGVAQVLDAEVEDVEAFVVTELIEGPTLEEDLTAGGPFSAAEMAGLAHGLAEALEAIHASGVVHRDLKPSNVMLSPEGPVLIDFGIAQVADDVRLTQTGLVTGTPGYLDPEVISGADPGPAGDWWAWAAVILHAATARPPFGRGSSQAVLARVSTGRCDSDGLPGVVSGVLRRALDPDPSRRAAAEEVMSVLDAVAADPDSYLSDDAAATSPLVPGPSTSPPPPPDSAPDAGPEAGGRTAILPAVGYPAHEAPPPPRYPIEPGTDATRRMPADAPAAPNAWQPGLGGQNQTLATDPGHQPVPGWAILPRPRPFTVLAVGIGLSALAPILPGVFLLTAAVVLLGAAMTGWASRARRTARMRRGVRPGDTARMIVALPWSLLRGLVALLPGLLLGAGAAAALWWVTPEIAGRAAEPAWGQEPVVLGIAAAVALTVVWLTPTSTSAREGARVWLAVVAPSAGYRAFVIAIFLLIAVVVAIGVLGDSLGAPTWAPFPITLTR
ncbi:serine/threonine-protein kinase [Bogoriella caseilytica]|uniref:Serine/threonine protein kinase n=1 Tax=Bogoriella caseilytica TaxID=56055 RepID=A0A3N2BDD6_9MICO|nr:serine/threonine-protein kinase [Bogoriella caseilytica]ROR73256.1 serine/threonine protein kinase [Bogoriella caseilytica]